MGQIVIMIIFGLAIAFSLKKQLDRVAREEGEREARGEEAEELWREAASRGLVGPQEPIQVEPLEEPVELIEVRPRAAPMEREAAPRVRRVRRMPPRKKEAARARPVEPPVRPIAEVRLGTMKPTAPVKGIYARRGEVALPKFKSPLVTAIVYHEILMPPVGTRTEGPDPFARIV